MDLILWRHAEAEAASTGMADADRSIKKARIWLFSSRVRHDETQTILRTVVSP